MARRPRFKRSAEDYKRGTLAPWPHDKPEVRTVAERARYIASGEHKTYPAPGGEWTFGPKADKAKCSRFVDAEWHLIQDALREAILAPCVDEEFRGDFPARVWAYINGVLHEARLSNRENGEYHGFPLEYEEHMPDDPHDLLRNAPRVAIAVH